VGLVKYRFFPISVMDAGIRVQRYACRIAEASVAMSKSGVADDGT
jgi:hypothetical protein